MFEQIIHRIVQTGKAHRWLRPFALLALLGLFGGVALAEWTVKQSARAWQAAGKRKAAFARWLTACRDRMAEHQSPSRGKPFRTSHRPVSRMAAAALAVCMVFTLMPQTAFAAEVQTGLCEHHPVHTPECGYQEAEPGHPCEHEHTADCYTDELICSLEETTTETASGSDAGHKHTQGCYALDCPHDHGEHDGSCGYIAAVEGVPCGNVCELCAQPVDSGNSGNGVETVTLVAFDGLDEAVQHQSVQVGTPLEELVLPNSLKAAVYTTAPDTEAVAIEGVTWEPDIPYEGAAGSYAFTASAAGYTCADGVDWPVITVTVEPGSTPYEAAVALFAALPAPETVAEMSDEEKDALSARLGAASDALTTLSQEDFDRFAEEHAAELDRWRDLQDALTGGADTLAENGDPIPTVDGYNIYANGLPIKIVAGGQPKSLGGTVYTRILYGTDYSSSLSIQGLTGDHTTGYDLSSYTIYGGSKNDNVDGNTKITMTGGKVTRIYGGGSASGSNSTANVSGSASVTISGGKVGFISGGGYAYNSGTATVNSASVTISDGEVTYLNGGGSASGSNSTANVSGDTSVEVSGGKVTYLYGGGSASSSGTANVSGSASVTISGTATVNGSVYGGGSASNGGTATVNSASVTISGGKVTYLYGGGYASDSGTATVNSASVTVSGGATVGDGTGKGIVINGGSKAVANGVGSFVIGDDLTGANGCVSVVLPAGYTGVTIATGAVEGDLARIKLTGGGAEGKTAYLDGTDIKVKAADADPTPTMESYNIYANGVPLILAAGSSDTTNTVIYIDKNGNGEIDAGDAIFDPDGDGNMVGTAAGNNLSLYNIYGGSKNADVTGNTKLTMTGGKVTCLYGGGYASGESSNANVSGSASVTISGGEVSDLSGGGKASEGSSNVSGSASVTISGGKVTYLYGGGYASGSGTATVNSASVTISGGEVSFLYGGGYASGESSNANVSGSASVTISGGEVTYLYGGGSAYNSGTANVSGSASVTISDGKVICLYGGGSAYSSGTATVNSASVTISDGEVTDLYGGGYASGESSNANVSGSASVAISGTATVKGSVYGGGYASDGGTATVSSRTVTISGGAKVGNGTKYGIVINGGSPNAVANGVDSFVVGDDLTGANGCVNVELPTGYTGVTIATGAVEGDLARIKLVGGGAEGKTAYFEGNAIKVKVAAVTPPTVTGVTVSPSTTTVQKGTTQQFSATVTGTNDPAQTVTWSIEGTHANGTGISESGLLTVASDETQATLTVKATSTADTSKYGTATVTVTTVEVTRYTLTVTDGNSSGDYEAGAEIQVTADTKENKRFKEWTVTGITLTDATENPVTITMPAGAVTLTANYEDDTPPAASYTITFNAGGGTVTPASAQTGADGKLQSLPTPTRSNHRFEGWFTAAEGGTAVTTDTTFTENSTIYAHWTYAGGGGGSSSGSGSGNSNHTPPTIVPPSESKPNAPISAETEIKAQSDGKGGAEVTVPGSAVDSAIQKAQEEAKRNGTQDNGIAVQVNVAANSQNINSLTVNLPKVTQEQIIDNKVQSFALALERPDITLSLSLASVQEINRQANADVQLTATRLTDTSKLSGEAKAVVGTRPLFQLTATYKGGANTITDFGSGSVTVEIPYKLQPGESAGGLYLVYIDGQGKPQFLTNSSYDREAEVLRGATTHFSLYAVGYKAPAAFSDVKDHWAKEDIEFVTARGLMAGVGNGRFNPDGTMTRAMFVTALGRLAGIDPAGYKSGTFTDVKADAYYAPYVEWAQKTGVVKGIGGGLFAPDRNVTRQEMAVIMANYAKAMGYKVPVSREALAFTDSTSIASWAAESVKTMQQAGVLMGKDGNRFDPLGNATRAQAAAVLHRYVELVIDRQTAQGLDINDSGSAMLWENGKLIKNQSRTVNSRAYAFNGYGEAALPVSDKKYRTHIVKKNEYFWSISRLYGCTMQEIMELNGLKMGDVIHPGDVLKVPEG